MLPVAQGEGYRYYRQPYRQKFLLILHAQKSGGASGPGSCKPKEFTSPGHPVFPARQELVPPRRHLHIRPVHRGNPPLLQFGRAKIWASARCRALRAQGIYPPSGVGATHRWLAGIFSARILHWYTCFRQTITIERDHHQRHHHHQGSDGRDGRDDQG